MSKVLFVDTVHPVLQEELIEMGYACDVNTTATAEAIKSIIADYEGAVIRSRIPFDRSMLEKASNLQFIARSGAGMENIDVPEGTIMEQWKYLYDIYEKIYINLNEDINILVAAILLIPLDRR